MGQKTILKPIHRRFLEAVSEKKYLTQNYYWTGGTVLSEFYLHHRDSEDIDLFTDKEEIQIGPVNSMISKMGGILGARKIVYTQYLGLHTYTFYLDGDETLKVDFNYYPFTRLEKSGKYGELVYDSILDIAVNKIETIAQRSRSRDFIDLYMIVKKYNY